MEDTAAALDRLVAELDLVLSGDILTDLTDAQRLLVLARIGAMLDGHIGVSGLLAATAPIDAAGDRIGAPERWTADSMTPRAGQRDGSRRRLRLGKHPRRRDTARHLSRRAYRMRP